MDKAAFKKLIKEAVKEAILELMEEEDAINSPAGGGIKVDPRTEQLKGELDGSLKQLNLVKATLLHKQKALAQEKAEVARKAAQIQALFEQAGNKEVPYDKAGNLIAQAYKEQENSSLTKAALELEIAEQVKIADALEVQVAQLREAIGELENTNDSIRTIHRGITSKAEKITNGLEAELPLPPPPEAADSDEEHKG